MRHIRTIESHWDHIILENVDIPVSTNPNKIPPMMIQPARRGDSPKRAPVNNFVQRALENETMTWEGIKKGWLSMELINTFFKILLPASTTLFIIIYFVFTVQKA